MTSEIPLECVLFGRAGCRIAENPGDLAVHVLESGLQDLLTSLVAVTVSAFARGQSVPPGLTSRFERCASRPTLGSLRDFLIWASSISLPSTFPSLFSILQRERKGGWLARLVELRNLWQHPKDRSREEILAQVAVELRSMPEELQATSLDIGEDGEVLWRSGPEVVALRPLAFTDAGELHLFSSFEPPSRLRFRVSEPSVEREFRDLWFELRVLDMAIEDPTPEELRVKAQRAAVTYDNDAPWWVDRVRGPGPCAMIVDTAVVDGALGRFGADKSAIIVDLCLVDDVTAPATLAERLGLVLSPDPGEAARELLKLGAGESLCVLALRCQGLSTRAFAQVLYWLADLREAGPAGSLRILLGRDRERLEADQEKLWDRLPEGTEELLRKPPGSTAGGVAAFLWPNEKPKRFLGLFRGGS